MNGKTDTPPLLPENALPGLGWNPWLEAHLGRREHAALTPARVTGTRKNSFYVSDGENEWLATVSGALNHRGRYPVAGDWVLTNGTVISEVLPRQNALSRGAAGARGRQKELAMEKQVIAANIDTVFIVCGLDRDFNLRRIERYLTLVYNCGLKPAVVLTKADLHGDPQRFEDEVNGVAFGAAVHLVSALSGKGLGSLEHYLSAGRTVCLIGSSGAGKSTLLNRLSGKQIQATGPVSAADGKGMHTTTTRDLIRMPQGGILIDNPGLREIAFWQEDGGIESVFPEIEALAAGCRFSDCTHVHEPGCRVLQALADQRIGRERLESYQKMKRELTFLSQRQHKTADRLEKERWKKITTTIKSMKKRGEL